MNLREVRECAERCAKRYGGVAVMSQYILSTIDPSPDEPITEQWVREEWGFEQVGVMDSDKFYLDHDYMHYLIILKDGAGVFYFDCDDGDLWPHDLHTRQQFCDLARALGIPRRKDGAK